MSDFEEAVVDAEATTTKLRKSYTTQFKQSVVIFRNKSSIHRTPVVGACARAHTFYYVWALNLEGGFNTFCQLLRGLNLEGGLI
jgi:hypothetical protein